MKYELVIKNGILVSEEGEQELDIAVNEGKIAHLGPRGTVQGIEEVDARGLLVLPGGIDTHVHFEEPGMTDWEDWEHASLAAAKGGVTTVVDMPVDNLPPTIDEETFLSKKEIAAQKSRVDFCLWGGLTEESLDTLEEMAKQGAVGFKAFLADCGGPYFPPADNGTLYEGMKTAARLQKLLTIHCEDSEMIRFYTQLIRAENRFDNAAWDQTRPEISELLAVNKVLFLAEQTGARVNIAHISSSSVVQMIEQAKRRGMAVSAETCAHYLHFDGEDVIRRGSILKCSPPIRLQEREALWQCLADGKIDFVASDHSPMSKELKMRHAEDMDRGNGGISGVQFTLPVLFTDGVKCRNLPLARLVSVFSANAARTLGIYGRKGALKEGFDADMVLFDPQREWMATPEDYLAKVKISPYLGEVFVGRVEATYVRGECVYCQGSPIKPKLDFAQMVAV